MQSFCESRIERGGGRRGAHAQTAATAARPLSCRNAGMPPPSNHNHRRLGALARHLRAAAQLPCWQQPAAGDEAPGPLAGVKVLDMTTVIAGPLTSGFFADMGADVIKLEKADGVGDGYKHAGTSRTTDEGVPRTPAAWAALPSPPPLP